MRSEVTALHELDNPVGVTGGKEELQGFDDCASSLSAFSCDLPEAPSPEFGAYPSQLASPVESKLDI